MHANRTMMNSTAHKSNTTSKSIIYSPVSKNKVNKPVATRKMIERISQRLFSSKSALATNEQRQSQKTMAELVKEFHQKTRVYDDKENPSHNKWKSFARCIPKSPKLLCLARNRPRNVLSQLEQEDLIAENIKKNTFKANPINKKIFEKKPAMLNSNQTLNKPDHKPIRVNEFKFRTENRLDARKQKDEKEHDNAGRFVFKARPMPNFKPVAIQTRTCKKPTTATLIPKQSSEVKLNEKPQPSEQEQVQVTEKPSSEQIDSIAPIEPAGEEEQQVQVCLDVPEDRSADEPQESAEEPKPEQDSVTEVANSSVEQEQLSGSDFEIIEHPSDETAHDDCHEQNEVTFRS